jgi:hypothetical protein
VSQTGALAKLEAEVSPNGFLGARCTGVLFLGTLFSLLKKEYLARGCDDPLPLKYQTK